MAVTSTPSISTRPLVGVSNPPSSLSSVVLPEPDAPSRPNRSPSPISSVTSSTATVSPKRLVSPSSLISGAISSSSALCRDFVEPRDRWLCAMPRHRECSRSLTEADGIGNRTAGGQRCDKTAYEDVAGGGGVDRLDRIGREMPFDPILGRGEDALRPQRDQHVGRAGGTQMAGGGPGAVDRGDGDAGQKFGLDLVRD